MNGLKNGFILGQRAQPSTLEGAPRREDGPCRAVYWFLTLVNSIVNSIINFTVDFIGENTVDSIVNSIVETARG